MPPDPSPEDEVVALHLALQEWFAGRLPPGEASFQGSLASRFASGFSRTSPEGVRFGREQLLAELRGIHGFNPSFRLSIRGTRLVAREGSLALVDFDELQQDDADPESGSLGLACTALLQREASAPGGWLWVHLHETWLGDDHDHDHEHGDEEE